VTAKKLEAIRKKRKWENLNWRNHLRDNEKRSPFTSLKNGLRHSFASHHYVGCSEAAKTRELLGQKSEGAFWEHYFHFVSKKEAGDYRAILPPAPARLAEIRPLNLAAAARVEVASKEKRKSHSFLGQCPRKSGIVPCIELPQPWNLPQEY